jgi:nickel/cobalt transporter (NicO) family protein
MPGSFPSTARMAETLVYLVSSFWLGAVHAATPGHGKTIAAAYIVGARGRPVDALVLGIFVTLSHTSGIVLVAVLASLGSAWLIPHRVETYLAFATGLLVIGIGLWMLGTQRAALWPAREPGAHESVRVGDAHTHGKAGQEHAPDHERSHDHGPEQDHAQPHDHTGDKPDHVHVHRDERDLGYHSHGWGRRHTHRIDLIAENRPKLAILLGLGVAGGLLPDPGALAILLAAIGSGRVMLGLFTVVVFSIGFASVLVVVGIVAARVGQMVLTWLRGRWVGWVQSGAALLIVAVGIVLTVVAGRTLAKLP